MEDLMIHQTDIDERPIIEVEDETDEEMLDDLLEEQE